MKNKSLCVANWKMNMFETNINSFIAEFNSFNLNSNVKYVLCPSFINLAQLNTLNTSKNYFLGAQDTSFNTKGAFTGEVSVNMLEDASCDYVIIGHSERRQFHNEDDLIVNKKLDLINKTSLIPIVCIGETFEQRKNGEELEVIEKQLRAIYNNIDINSDLIIAYEPIWAIGTGLAADIDTVTTMHNHIENIIKKMYENNCNIYLLYGGSVNESNAKSIASIDNVNGFLIGSASLNPLEFYNISKSL